MPDEDLAALLHGAAAVVVVPSRAEGFGLPVLEGMAAGVPVVSSDDPALGEVGGGAAAVVPVGDADALAGALARVVSEEDLHADLVRRGRERARAFTWTGAAERMWDVYREVVV